MTTAPDPAGDVFQRAAVNELGDVDTDGRTITVRLVPWNAPHDVLDAGRPTPYRETFARGGLIPPPADDPIPVYVEREHNGPVVGIVTGYDDRPDGLYGTIRVSRSTAGADTLADLAERILRYVSVDFYDRPVPRAATEVTRTAARLRRVAFTLTPAHDAPVLAMRSTPDPEPINEQEPEPMTTTATPDAPAAPTPDPAPADPGTDVVSTRSAPDDRAPVGRPSTLAAVTPTRDRFESFGHFVRAAAAGDVSGDELAVFQRALADVVTGDVSGMIREQWIGEVIDLARTYTPTVNNWRSRPLPSTGMSMSQPVVTTRPTVGKQTTQKSEITSTDVVIGVEQWAIDTYAGGNDVSLQTINRTDPDFLNEMMRLYVREMAQKINDVAAAGLFAAAAVGVSGNTALEYVDAEKFDALVIDASAAFLSSTGLRRPAELMAISVDLWSALGKARDLTDRPLYPDINPMNSAGTFDATATTGQVRRISWYVEPDLGAGISGVIGVAEAFVTARGPVQTLTADVPSKIGRDVAVWQECAIGPADASGLVQIVNDTP